MVFADLVYLWFLGPLYVLWALWYLSHQLLLTPPLWLSSLGKRLKLGWLLGERAPSWRAPLLFSEVRLLKQLGFKRRWVGRKIVLSLRLLAVLSLLLACLRPETGRKEIPLVTEGVQIMLVLDTSESMRALDLDANKPLRDRANRLAVAKRVVAKFIEQREHDEMGMVIFGEEAFTQCPLTLDHGILATFLDRVEIGMAGNSTAIGSALGTAINRLKKTPAKSKVIILLTDGRSNAGALEPLKAAEIAQNLGIKIYTIAAGTLGKAPFLQDTIFGKQVVYEDMDIDEELLQQVASLTGGAYFRATDERALANIYQQIDRLEKSTFTEKAYLEYTNRFAWFVSVALICLVLEIVLLGTKFSKIP